MTAKKKAFKYLLLLLIILTLCCIWGNSLMYAERSSELSNGLLDVLRPWMYGLGLNTDDDHGLRNLAHLTEFGLLGLELAILFFLEERPSYVVFRRSALLSLLTAIVDELLQCISDRSAQLLDVGLDFAGACLGIVFVWLIVGRRNKRRE